MSKNEQQFDSAIVHGMRKGDFVWWLADKDTYRPTRVVQVLSPTSLIVRPWRWTDWFGYAVHQTGWWIKCRWWAMVDRIEEWRGE